MTRAEELQFHGMNIYNIFQNNVFFLQACSVILSVSTSNWSTLLDPKWEEINSCKKTIVRKKWHHFVRGKQCGRHAVSVEGHRKEPTQNRDSFPTHPNASSDSAMSYLFSCVSLLSAFFW